MTALELISGYSHVIDVSSIIFCVVLSIIIRYVLYFSTDSKFRFVKRAIIFIFCGSFAKILFEGVETEAHEDICKACGANYLQGFKFSRPIPINELRNYLLHK